MKSVQNTLLGYIGAILLGMMLFAACEAPLDLPVESQSSIVISGVLTNSLNERVIFVRREGGFDGSVSPISASGTVYENDEPWSQLIQDSTGYLSLPFGFQFEEGNSYFVEITFDGKTYRTEPQVILPRIETDSMSFELNVRRIGVSADGRAIDEAVIDVFAHVNIPESLENPRYYRWQVDEVWSFQEVSKPEGLREPDELDIIDVCYLSASVAENSSTLLNSQDVSTGDARVLLSTRAVDESFLQRHVYSAYLHTVDQRAYEYYENSARISQLGGNLYDEVPAAVKGNVFSLEQDNELVLGYVEISQADTFRLSIRRDQIDFVWYDQCRPEDEEGADCNFPPQPPGDTSTVYCKCYDCWRIYGRETLERPAWW